jgi:very-short-patch-repair endonuclease
MVASVEGEGRTAPLVREAFRQRFNVAASRARDQLWLFHSIRESDLHPDCMRRRLIHYCYNPHAIDTEKNEQAYESQFERDVANDLIGAGFRVLSQFEFAGKRIDLVVEDNERRIAVECDGDTWHGPDQYDADAARQRMLERCGWTFLRIRGSVYYANQGRAAQELIEAIVAHGIRPHVTSNETAARDWVKEVSGNQFMEQLGAHAVDATEHIVQPAEAAPDEVFEIDELNGDVAITTDGKANNDLFKANGAIQTQSVGSNGDGAVVDDAATAAVNAVDSNVWFQIARWAKQNDQLAGWQRGLAYSLGVRKRQGIPPTEKQTKQGKRILDEAAMLGFKPNVEMPASS